MFLFTCSTSQAGVQVSRGTAKVIGGVIGGVTGGVIGLIVGGIIGASKAYESGAVGGAIIGAPLGGIAGAWVGSSLAGRSSDFEEEEAKIVFQRSFAMRSQKSVVHE